MGLYNTSSLQTQYVGDLENQVALLRKALKDHGVEVSNKEGLNTLIEKVNNIKPNKVYIPYLVLSTSNPTDLNLIDPIIFETNNLKGILSEVLCTNVDLSNWHFNNVESLECFISANGFNVNSSVTFTFGKNFNIENIVNMNQFFNVGRSYGSANNRSYSIKDIDEIPNQNVSKLKYINMYCNTEKSNTTKYALKFLLKLYNAAPIEMTHLFTAPDSGVSSDVGYWGSELNDENVEYIVSCIEHITKHWDFTNLKKLSYNFVGLYRFNDGQFNRILSSFYKWKVAPEGDVEYIFYDPNRTDDKNGYALDIKNIVFDNVTSIKQCFSGLNKCVSLTMHNLKTKQDTLIFNNVFRNLSNLESLIMHNCDFKNVTQIYSSFTLLPVLQNLSIAPNLGGGYTTTSRNNASNSIDLSSSQLLTKDSVVDLFDKLYDLNKRYLEELGKTTVTTQQIKLHADVKAKLTPEEIAIATNKGWSIA